MAKANPFSLVRASDYTNDQINSLWVELGDNVVVSIIEPRSRSSKFILGGKGTGKTHLLRYHSYPVARLRNKKKSGLETLKKINFLGVFLRATSLDSSRFEINADVLGNWQLLFGVYLELRLVEGVLDAFCDIKASTRGEFREKLFIEEISKTLTKERVSHCNTLEELKAWVVEEKREIDDAINNAAFTGEMDVRIPFSLGTLCLNVSRAAEVLNASLVNYPIVYMIDEIENFTEMQQQVVNTLVRYGEGFAAFRITGRLYSIKTLSTLAGGEENREGAEFTTVHLDTILRNYSDFPAFARKFVHKRMASHGILEEGRRKKDIFDVDSRLDQVNSDGYFSSALSEVDFDECSSNIKKDFLRLIESTPEGIELAVDEADRYANRLTSGFPLILQKLNLLVFCKKYSRKNSISGLVEYIREECLKHINGEADKKGYYHVSYGHYSYDLFAQICRESKNLGRIPYAGFDTFLRMSSGNVRNLLIILGRIYSISDFRGVEFIGDAPLKVALQTDGALEAARFMYESDTNFGKRSEQARESITRLAELLRTARFAMSIPEVSPLAVSFSDGDLTPKARVLLESSLNYSFLFEVVDGRPDRNSGKMNRKVQLNPLLSPRWGLPVSRRGDVSLGKEMLNAIFDPDGGKDFDHLLKKMKYKWNNLLPVANKDLSQGELF